MKPEPVVNNKIGTVRHEKRHQNLCIKLELKSSDFKQFLKGGNVVQVLSWDELFQILRALNRNTVPTKEFDCMNVIQEILTDIPTLFLVYIP